MADPPPYHCKDCGLVFDSSKSLDVHLHYHKENLLSKWAQQPTSDESNNNHVKKINRTTTVPADSQSEANNMMPTDRYYQHHIPVTSSFVSPPSHDEPHYVLGGGGGFPQMPRTPTPNSCSSPSPHHPPVPSASSNYRYHPYHQYTASPDHHHRNGHVSSSSPQQCDKCGFVCESGLMLMEHLSVAHPPSPTAELFDHPELNIKMEPVTSQAEILDLDSHKVHVYQPPPPAPPQEHSVSTLMSWVNSVPEKERFHPHNGSGLSSPDCYSNVSTTTVTPPDHSEMLPHQQPSTYQFDQHIPQLGANNQQQISSTQIPIPVNQPPTQTGKMMKQGNATWKANDARRPKTYNCSACNKWFTSSGHLKRHYNTTLHKNAVKQSGAPDPASMPISSHHHPQKDPTFLSPPSPAEPPEEPAPPAQQQPPPQQQSQPSSHLLNHHFLPSPPNLMAGPPEVTGGLLLHTTPYQEVSPTAPTHTFLPFHHTPTYPHPQHPNFQPPHVSTDPQVTTSNIFGNLSLLDIQNYLMETGKREMPQQQHQLPLPSFAQFNQNNIIFSSFQPVVSSSDSNVGGLSHPDQISSNLIDSIYHSSPSPLCDSYSLDNMQSSIEEKPFCSPDNSGNISSSDVNSTNEENQEDIYTSASEPDLPSMTENKFNMNYLLQTKQSNNATAKLGSTLNFVKCIKLVDPLKLLNNDMLQMKQVKTENDSINSGLSVNENLPLVKNIKVEDNYVSSTIEHDSPPPSATPRNTSAPMVHKCIDCDKVFNKACYLTQHNKSFHSGVKPFKCERCGKRFNAEYLHLEHISKHAGDKPYKCEICPKQFNHKTDLRRHMCLHTGDKPYSCDICGKGFIRKDHMLKHCDTHKRRPTSRGFKPASSKIPPLKQRLDQNSLQAVLQPSTLMSTTPTHNPAVQTLQMVM